MTRLGLAFLVVSSAFLCVACGGTRAAGTKSSAASVVKNDSAAAPTASSLPPGITQAEIQWALTLEKRVKTENYQPNAQEMAQYEDLSHKLAQEYSRRSDAGNQTAPGAAPVSQSEIDWALALESRVKTENYKATPQEIARYEDVTSRLARQQLAPQQPSGPADKRSGDKINAPHESGSMIGKASNSVTAQELEWATQLQAKVQEGYRATPAEIQTYQDIYLRHQAGQDEITEQAKNSAQVGPSEYGPQPGHDSSSTVTVPEDSMDPDLVWALRMLDRVQNAGYVPTETETARYQKVLERFRDPDSTK